MKNIFKEKLAAKQIYLAMMLIHYLFYSYPQNLLRQYKDRSIVLGSELKCYQYEQEVYLVVSAEYLISKILPEIHWAK